MNDKDFNTIFDEAQKLLDDVVESSTQNMSKMLGALLQHATDTTLSMPVYCVVVSSNGQIVAGRYEELGGRTQFTELCEHTPDPNMKFPINLYLSDSSGRSMHAL